MHPAFSFDQYILKRQVFALTGKFRLYDPSGTLVLFSQQRMFKLKEDIRIYSDESSANELLHIQARQAIDFSATYDVFDQSEGGLRVGSLKRKGWNSMARDEWEVMAPSGEIIGTLIEDSLGLALLRRLILGSLLPQNYDIIMAGMKAADLKQRFNLFRYELDIDFSIDPSRRLDHRLGIAAGILMATIEGRQSS